MKQQTQDTAPIREILKRKRNGIDCTEQESAELMGFIKDTYDRPTDEELTLQDQIEILFPIEFSEAYAALDKAGLIPDINPVKAMNEIVDAIADKMEKDEQAEGLIQAGMKVWHKYVNGELTVVADEKGPAYTGEEFKDDEISLSHAIREYQNGNLTIEQAEGFTGGDWHVSHSPVTKSKLSGRFYKSVKNTKSIGGKIIVNAFGDTKEEAEANAALISQAKNMYFLLKWISKVTNNPEIGIKCDAMLKKANPIKQ